MLVPPQLPALVPGQQADDVVLDAGASQGLCGEMVEIVNSQGLDAREFSHSPKPFPKIPRNDFFGLRKSVAARGSFS